MNTTAKIGLFALVVLLALGVLVLKIEDIAVPGRRRGRPRREVHFADVAGLDDKSAVRIAGVRVGKVDGIRLLPDGTAVSRIAFDGDVELRDGAWGQIEEPRPPRRQVRRPLRRGTRSKPRLPDGARIPGRVPDAVRRADEAREGHRQGRQGADGGPLAARSAGETGEEKINRIVDNVGALAE